MELCKSPLGVMLHSRSSHSEAWRRNIAVKFRLLSYIARQTGLQSETVSQFLKQGPGRLARLVKHKIEDLNSVPSIPMKESGMVVHTSRVSAGDRQVDHWDSLANQLHLLSKFQASENFVSK